MLNLIAFITLIGVLITAHELGHFIVAKLCKVKVHTFSIGFGRAVLSKTIGETEYRVALLPLGGYVRLHGMEREFGDLGDDSLGDARDANHGLEMDAGHDAPDDPDAGRALQDKPAWMRVLIFAAGPAMNLLLPFVLLPPLFLSAGEYDQVIDHRMGAVDAGLPAYRAGLRDGDAILEVDGDEIYAFWQVQEKVSGFSDGAAPLRVTIKRPTSPDPISVDLTPERVASTGRFSGPVARPFRIGFQPATRAADYISNDPHGVFERAGGRPFDRILRVDQTAVDSHVEAITALGQTLAPERNAQVINVTVERLRPLDARWTFLSASSEVTLKLNLIEARTRFNQARERALREHPDEPIDSPALIASALGIRQAGACVTSIDPASAAGSALKVGDCLLEVDGARHSLAVFFNQRLRYQPEVPKRLKVLRAGQEVEVELRLRQETHSDPLAGEVKFWQLGFTLSSLSRAGSMMPPKLVDNRERVAFSWCKTKRRVSGEVEHGLHSILGLFSGQVQPTQLSGPITIFYLAGRQAEAGWIPFLNLMVLISISIALLNLMPIPGLDGGHILFAGIEMITRRPLPQKYRMMIQIVGVLMIFVLMLFALGSDLLRMWRLSSGS